VESHSIDHLLRPTDKFVVGTFKLQQQRIRLSVEIKVGIVAYDPNSSVNIAARISGRIEKCM
jgi:Cu(I)/Ag(I) efflux system membrane fusion protein